MRRHGGQRPLEGGVGSRGVGGWRRNLEGLSRHPALLREEEESGVDEQSGEATVSAALGSKQKSEV